MIKYLIFDIDDTLLETFMNSYFIFLELAKQYGIKSINKQEFLEQYMGGDFDKNIEHFFGACDSIEHAKVLYNDLKKQLTKRKFIDVEYLDKLSSVGYKFGILTNGPELKTYEKLNYLGITELCSIIFHAGNMHYKKPNPLVFKQVLEVLKVEQRDIIYIGDALVDYYAARDADVPFYAVLTGYTTKQEFMAQELSEEFIFQDINSLLLFLYSGTEL